MGCCCNCSITKKLSVLVLIVALVAGLFCAIDRPSNFVFDNKMLESLGRAGLADAQTKAESALAGSAPSVEMKVNAVINQITTAYPKYTKSSGRWLFNNAGGAMGQMTVLHCSMSEYLIIFGSATGTEGHSGRFWAEDFVTVLHGEQWTALPNQFDKTVTKPGQTHYLPRNTAKQFRTPDQSFVLEYARGNVLSMMLFGMWDTLFSTLDFVTLASTIRESGGSMMLNALQGKI